MCQQTAEEGTTKVLHKVYSLRQNQSLGATPITDDLKKQTIFHNTAVKENTHGLFLSPSLNLLTFRPVVILLFSHRHFHVLKLLFSVFLPLSSSVQTPPHPLSAPLPHLPHSNMPHF